VGILNQVKSDVQFGQRTALIGTLVAQNGHSLVVTGATASSFLFRRFIVRTKRKIGNEIIRKLTMLFTNSPIFNVIAPADFAAVTLT